MAMQSTAQAKYWNYPGGWDQVVDHLNNLDYEVLDIDLHHSFGGAGYMNSIPSKAVDMTGCSLIDCMNYLRHAEMYIGLSSGISWLAWAMGIPSIIISGFSSPKLEPSTNVVRLHDTKGCNSCFSDPKHTFDKNNWAWCPENEGFSCTKRITPKRVIGAITYHRLNKGEMKDMEKAWIVREHLGDEFGYNRFYEPKDGDIIVDIGACLGLYTTLTLQETNVGKCYHVEPLPTNIRALKQNIKTVFGNDKNHVIVEKAVAAKTGKMHLTADSDWTPCLTEYAGSADRPEGIEVDTTTFIDFVKSYEIGHIDMLKIDCEGGELAILESDEAMHFIADNVLEIAGELHLTAVEDCQRAVDAIKRLETYGFELYIHSVYGSIDIKDRLFSNEFLPLVQKNALDFYKQVVFWARNLH